MGIPQYCTCVPVHSIVHSTLMYCTQHVHFKQIALLKNVLRHKDFFWVGHVQGWQYGTVRRYGTPQFLRRGTVRFFVMVRVRYVDTVRLFCKGTGTLRWYLL